MPITDAAPAVTNPAATVLPAGLAQTSQDSPGFTNSVPVNVGVGGGVVGGANAGISATAGWEAAVIGGVVVLVLGALWELSFFKQRPKLRYGVTAVVCIGVGILVFHIAGNLPTDQAIAKGCSMVLGGVADEFGVKISGITDLVPTPKT